MGTSASSGSEGGSSPSFKPRLCSRNVILLKCGFAEFIFEEEWNVCLTEMGKPVDGENLAASNATIPLEKNFFSGRILCYERFLYFGIGKIGLTTTNESSYQTVLHWIWGTLKTRVQLKNQDRWKKAGEKGRQEKKECRWKKKTGKTSQELWMLSRSVYLIVNHYSSMSWLKFRNLSVIVNTNSLNHSKSKSKSLSL